ncbi:MAG: hypothetical protein QOH36_462, partial [Actinomycetota bacterium]|nr:hypothetical protein [Actinomycetota bacterium]
SQVEMDHDKQLADEIWLRPASRVGCNPETGCVKQVGK